MADNVLYMGVRGVTDLMVNPGMVNLDFADIRTVMAEMGKAMMGTGESEGDDRATKAAEAAISNPLLEDISMAGAKGVLINITGGYDMTLFEVDAAANRIRKEVDEDANIIFGTSVDEGMNGRVRVSVVATGIDVATAAGRGEVPLKLVANGAPTQAVATQSLAPAAAAPRAAATSFIRTVAAPSAMPTMRPAVVDPTPETQAEPAPEAYAPVQPAPVETPVVMGPAAVAAEPAPRLAEPPRPAAPGMMSGLFKRATGITGMMRRTLPEPAAPAPAPVLRVEPSVAPQQAAPAAPRAARPSGQEDMGLEIPTFLRRQSNP
jgi:cell division protein FtsZ